MSRFATRLNCFQWACVFAFACLLWSCGDTTKTGADDQNDLGGAGTSSIASIDIPPATALDVQGGESSGTENGTDGNAGEDGADGDDGPKGGEDGSDDDDLDADDSLERHVFSRFFWTTVDLKKKHMSIWV